MLDAEKQEENGIHPILWELSVQWGAGTPTRFLQWSDGKVGVLSSDWTLLPGGRSTLHGFVSPLEAPLSLLLSPDPTPGHPTSWPKGSSNPNPLPLFSSEQQTRATFSTLLEVKEYKEYWEARRVCVCQSLSYVCRFFTI